jgi:hypothetical protein
LVLVFSKKMDGSTIFFKSDVEQKTLEINFHWRMFSRDKNPAVDIWTAISPSQ